MNVYTMFRHSLLSLRTSLKNYGSEKFPLAPASFYLMCGSNAGAVPLVSSALHTSACLNFGRNLKKRGGGKFVQDKPILEGENSEPIESSSARRESPFPDIDLPNKIFNGIMYKDLPILNVQATPNNTIMSLTDSKGVVQTTRSCGYDGFKNARKGTNVAAQATGFTLGKKLMQRGVKTVRVRVMGLGAGRLSSLRGISFAGVQIVSITDSTPVSWNPPRARKQRRV